MHILPLFEPALLNTDSYGSLSQMYWRYFAENNIAKSVIFLCKAKQALRNIFNSADILKYDISDLKCVETYIAYMDYEVSLKQF